MTYHELEVFIPLLDVWLPRGIMAPSLTAAKQMAFEPFGQKGWEVTGVREYKGKSYYDDIEPSDRFGAFRND